MMISLVDRAPADARGWRFERRQYQAMGGPRVEDEASTYNAWAQSLIRSAFTWADICMRQKAIGRGHLFHSFTGGTMGNPSIVSRPDSDPNRSTTSTGTGRETTWTTDTAAPFDQGRQSGQQSGQPQQAAQGTASPQGGPPGTQPDTDEGSSMRRSMDDADAVGRKVASTAQGYLHDVKDKAGSVTHSAKSYARSAVDAAGEKIQGMKEQAGDLRVKGQQYVMGEPIKAILCAAAGGALITALLLALSAPRR
ncbi:hypothetical protein [Variovorax ginsengisoli]|uniref:CsbD family protein n=1 Tax=Variovorax ginsengisoli TaxID=363844 RepID=A0ABT8S3G5_9BURK|nr:hypothetical protein [Variovorax ginsengisoli]MDN8613617.1 hypothetical protein [Variovorax ginsengisoli]MDO1532787.1 hypothetical protein [Variovorax ginsengisoli]